MNHPPYPYEILSFPSISIPLSSVSLSAHLYLPSPHFPSEVFPTILEYLPYGKNTGTAIRDYITHRYFCGFGYACLRVDIRGNGESEGLMFDEYLKEEQDDCLEVIEWIIHQKWSDGKVGMMGISWGGFNSLQVAYRRPDALKVKLINFLLYR